MVAMDVLAEQQFIRILKRPPVVGDCEGGGHQCASWRSV